MKILDSEEYINEKVQFISKALNVTFTNIRRPDEALDHITALAEDICNCISDKVKYMNIKDEDYKTWVKIEERLRKITDDYVASVDELEKDLMNPDHISAQLGELG